MPPRWKAGQEASGHVWEVASVEDASALLAAVEAVDDSSLALGLGAALGTSISVTSSAAQQATTTVVVESTCPPGHYCTDGNIVPCEANTYNPLENVFMASGCLACPLFAKNIYKVVCFLSGIFC